MLWQLRAELEVAFISQQTKILENKTEIIDAHGRIPVQPITFYPCKIMVSERRLAMVYA